MKDRIGLWGKRVVCLALVLLLLAGCSRANVDDQTGNAPAANDGISIGDRQQTAQNTVQNDIERPSGELQSRERKNKNNYGVYYEVFVRSFADSDGDGIGDFNGLIAQLDYLNDGNPDTDTDLGIDGIWLMPVNTSPSYHKYDVMDYYGIDPEYGTMDDFKRFLDEAHKRGIKVIMDLVINHTSSQHPWFVEASRSEDSPYRDYYRWAKEGQDGYNLNGVSSWGSKVWHKKGDSYYYGIFWDQMPDLNYDNPKVREEIKKVAKFWLETGVDGFRLDAAMHIYGAYESSAGTNYQEKNLEWWKEFREYVETINPNAYLVGEVYDKTPVIAPYYQGLDSLFNFELGEGIIKVVNLGSVTAVGGKGFALWLEEMYEQYSSIETNFLDAPFLTNHDQNRSMNQLGKDVEKAKLAAGIYLTLPGNPFIYYGEEIGMLGTKPDERIREPFVWSGDQTAPQTSWESNVYNTSTVPADEQQKDENSLLNCYKRLIRLRHSSRALRMGDFKALESGSRKVIAYSRSYVDGGNEDETVIVLHNLGNEVETFELSGEYPQDYKLLYETTGQGKIDADGTKVKLKPRTTVILQKKVQSNGNLR